jgi:DNA-binding NarL/FixJ family response regulator
VVDDDPDECQVLVDILLMAGDIDVLAGCADGSSAMDTVVRERPDVVLIKPSLPRTDVVETTRCISQRQPSTRVLICAENVPDVQLEAAVAAGAAGVALVDLDPFALADAVRFVASLC